MNSPSQADINTASAAIFREAIDAPPCALARAALGAVNFPALKDAALRLYMAGRWELAGTPGSVQIEHWEALRDALGLKIGAAMEAGIHDPLPPHGCPRCDDAIECDCEPRLPFGAGR